MNELSDFSRAVGDLGTTADEAAETTTLFAVKRRLSLLWDALDALRRDFDRTGEHDRANSILAAQEHVEALQREVGGL